MSAASKATEASTYQRLRGHLAALRLQAAAEALPAELERATAEPTGHTAFLERLLAVEVAAAQARRQASLARFACLPAPWRLGDFDFDAQPSVDRKLVAELGSLRFVAEHGNVLLIGPPGSARRCWRSPSATPPSTPACGPTTPPPPSSWPAATRPPSKAAGDHDALLRRAQAADHRRAGVAAHARRGCRGAVPGRHPTLRQGLDLPDDQPRGGVLGRIFDDPMVAAAMLDRLLHRSVVLNIDGPSYRMRAHQARAETLRAGTKGADRCGV